MSVAAGSSGQPTTMTRMFGIAEHVMDGGLRSVLALKPGAVGVSLVVLNSGQALAVVGRRSRYTRIFAGYDDARLLLIWAI